MATVPTITRNVAGRSLSAPPRLSATSGAANVDAVDAATMPRGSIHPMKMRSCRVRFVPHRRHDGDDGPHDQHEARHEGECWPDHAADRLGCHRGRDRDEEQADGELDDRLEHGTFLGHVDRGQVGQGDADRDGGDQSGVVADGVACSGDGHDRGEIASLARRPLTLSLPAAARALRCRRPRRGLRRRDVRRSRARRPPRRLSRPGWRGRRQRR